MKILSVPLSYEDGALYKYVLHAKLYSKMKRISALIAVISSLLLLWYAMSRRQVDAGALGNFQW